MAERRETFPSSHLQESRARSKLKTSISLNTEARARGPLAHVAGSPAQPLSPIEYQFLLRRASAVSEELVEVSTRKGKVHASKRLTSVNRAP